MLDAQKKDQDALKQKSADVQKNYSKFLQLSQSIDAQAKEITTQQAQLKVATLNYQATIATAQGTKDQLLAQKAAAEKAAADAAAQQAAYEAQQKASNDAQQQAQTPSAPADNGSSNSNSNNSNNNSNNSNSGNSNNGGGSTVTPPSGGGSQGTGSAGNNPYAGGGCTDYVWQYFAAQGIYIGNIMPGNGGQWATNGPAQGILHVVGEAPGVIASGYSANFVGYAGSPYGHVAIVTAVHADGTFDVIEGGYGSGWWGHTRQNLSPAGVTFLMPN
jgi:surface antigen